MKPAPLPETNGKEGVVIDGDALDPMVAMMMMAMVSTKEAR